LYDPAVVATPAEAAMRAWKPPVAGVREVFHAQFADHAYPPHTHDAWTLFIVDDGVIRYDLDRRPRAAEPGMVSILPPHVVHDGRAATADGFRKRVLYLETSILGEHLIGPAVDRPEIGGPSLRRDLSALHDALGCIDDLLAAENRLAFVAERIRGALGEPPAERPTESRNDLADRLRAYLDAHAFEPVTMAAAADHLDSGVTQLARAFTDVFGIPPHAYVIGRRLDAARDRILGGQPLADVAADVGFFDQAHLTRRFKRYLGTTPGRFARA
jgi:AraC-like DNA-binding protein